MEKKEVRRYDLFSQFAMGAAVQAVRDACLEKSPLDPKRIGGIIGNGTGGVAPFGEEMRTLTQKGPGRGAPVFVALFMAEVACGGRPVRLRVQGPGSRPV